MVGTTKGKWIINQLIIGSHLGIVGSWHLLGLAALEVIGTDRWWTAASLVMHVPKVFLQRWVLSQGRGQWITDYWPIGRRTIDMPWSMHRELDPWVPVKCRAQSNDVLPLG